MSAMPTFSQVFPQIPVTELAGRARQAAPALVEAILARGEARTLAEFAALLSPAAGERLDALAAASQRLTRRHFGRVVRLFAPIYLSNECVNVCLYCGFSRHNAIPRITLPLEQVEEEVRKLARQGFRALLIVAGEHPRYVSNGYVGEVVRRCLPHMPSLSLELGPLETQDYLPLVRAGSEGLVVYQETYHAPTYALLHTAGPKKHYGWRMDTLERGYAAGFRRLGLGALLGLHDWREEAVATAAHALHLHQHCWRAFLTVSFPRMRPAAGGFQPDPAHLPDDRQLVQLICAFRLLLPHAGLVLSTREPARLRDGLIPLGITQMSAGSSTEPGGYSHFDESQWVSTQDQPGEQFAIADERPPRAVAEAIRRHGYEPVWKDHDQVLTAALAE